SHFAVLFCQHTRRSDGRCHCRQLILEARNHVTFPFHHRLESGLRYVGWETLLRACAYFFFALPPLRPPLRELVWLDFFPRPLPLFLPPLSCLLTVAQARRSASFLDVPRFS